MKKEEIEKYVMRQFLSLLLAYDQDMQTDKIQRSMKLIMYQIMKYKQLSYLIIDNTYHELLENYTFYRKINAASYMTAFVKKAVK